MHFRNFWILLLIIIFHAWKPLFVSVFTKGNYKSILKHESYAKVFLFYISNRLSENLIKQDHVNTLNELSISIHDFRQAIRIVSAAIKKIEWGYHWFRACITCWLSFGVLYMCSILCVFSLGNFLLGLIHVMPLYSILSLLPLLVVLYFYKFNSLIFHEIDKVILLISNLAFSKNTKLNPWTSTVNRKNLLFLQGIPLNVINITNNFPLKRIRLLLCLYNASLITFFIACIRIW